MRFSLNIEIAVDDIVYACALYEGSAFMDVAMSKLSVIVRETRNAEYRLLTDHTEQAIWLLEMTGAGADWMEQKMILGSRYHIADCINSGEGFLYITDRGIDYSRSVEDARATVYLDRGDIGLTLCEAYEPWAQDGMLCSGVVRFEDISRFRKFAERRR